jgi:prepilin-type N-terminal cleavage/methylation domain-containing protein
MTKSILKPKLFSINGYTMIELLLAIVVGSIVLAGAYASYSVVSGQFNANLGVIQINQMATPTIKILEEKIKIAGYKAVDSDIESSFGKIDNPITILDSGDNVCCDEFTVIYDKDLANRFRERYYIANRAGLNRKALFLDKDKWNGVSWDIVYSQALVADFIEDMQISGADLNSKNQPTLINLNLIFRSKNKLVTPQNFVKKTYLTGNSNFTLSSPQNYFYKEVETTVRIRNLVN